MTWFKVDDHLHASRKAAKAGAAAMGLWVLAGSWSAAEELDGFVPAYMVARLAGGEGDNMASALVRAGLWLEGEHDGEAGFRFHQWAEYQPTKAQLDQKREDARERMRRARAKGGDVRANSASTSHAVTPTPTRPDPSLNNTPSRKRSDSDKAGDDFAAFWQQYPNKTGKQAAAKAWTRAIATGATPDAIRTGLTAAVAVWAAERRESRFIPHPATWLNQGRWEDEQTQIPLPASRPATLMQCSDGDPHGRHQWQDGPNLCHCQGVAA